MAQLEKNYKYSGNVSASFGAFCKEIERGATRREHNEEKSYQVPDNIVKSQGSYFRSIRYSTVLKYWKGKKIKCDSYKTLRLRSWGELKRA